MRIRTDLSATLFLSAPEEYDGGELLVEDTYGVQQREARRRVAWSSTPRPACTAWSRSRAARASASFFWIQSMVRDDAQRTLLFDLDMAIVRLTRDHPGDPALVSLTGVYHNLLRMWAEP